MGRICVRFFYQGFHQKHKPQNFLQAQGRFLLFKSDIGKFVPVYVHIRENKDLFYSCANLIEWIAFKPVLAFQLAHGDMFRA